MIFTDLTALIFYMKQLLTKIQNCTICAEHLALGPRPVVSAAVDSKIAIIGQAPGLRVHQSGIPWDDKSGERLRDWLGVTPEQFYDPQLIALIPMGFCYPGKGKSGDLPPRKECAPEWHEQLLDKMHNIAFTILIGAYSQAYYLPESKSQTLTERIQNFEQFLPSTFVLPHPSPRNNIWMKKNPWFAELLLPELRKRVSDIL